MTDLLGGQVQMMFENIGIVLPLMKSGKLKAIAVMAPQRVSITPNLPTLAEHKIDMGNGTWLGLLAPAKTPKVIIDKLHEQVVAALNTPEVRKAFEDRVIQPVGNTPQEFAKHIQTETAQWKQLVAKAGLQIQ